MSTRSGRVRTSIIDTSPVRTRKGVSPPRSPARTRKTSPTATKNSSPVRTTRKSPSRKSPNRKTPSKFPARKSPSRSTKEVKSQVQTAEVAPQIVHKSPSKRPAIKTDIYVRLDDLSSKLETFRNTRSKRIEYSVRDLTLHNEYDVDKINGIESLSDDIQGLRYRRSIDDPAPRRSSRLKEFIEKFENNSDIRRSISHSVSQSKSVSKSLDAYSDEEQSLEVERQKSKSVTRKLATPLRSSISSLENISSKWEFGGRVGSIVLIFLIPLVVFSLLISCKTSCSFKPDFSMLNDLKRWFTIKSCGFILAQYLIQAIISLIPIFGSKSDRMDESGTKYCFNALFSSIFTMSILFMLDFLKIVNKEFILREYLQLATMSYIFGIILSIFMYFKSRNMERSELNVYGNTGYTLYDFFMGREIHPFIKTLDIKIWISRISNVTSLALLVLICSQGLQLHISENELISLDNYKQILSKIQLKPTLLLFATMQIIYILYFIVGEYKVTSTFFWQSEGVGYLQIVSSVLYPFYFTTISKYVADNELKLSINALISASVLFMLGYIILLISNNIKHEFRINPLQPGLAHLNSMPTFHGKKLLVGNLWGWLRHPNYTGDIIIHIALAIPGVMSRQVVAASPALLTILMLVHRAWRDHGRCRKRYGAAWQRYCKRVPSAIVPKVL